MRFLLAFAVMLLAALATARPGQQASSSSVITTTDKNVMARDYEGVYTPAHDGEAQHDTCNASEVWQPDYAGGKCVPGQYAVMVWEARCLDGVQLGKETRLEMPLINGEPDKKHAVIYRVLASYREECGHIERRTR